MRLTIGTLLCLFIMNLSNGQSISNVSLQDVNGNSISLTGSKKVLFLIAPLREADSSMVKELGSFKNEFGDSIKVIGILSYEDGYADSIKASVIALYQSRGIDITLTAPMYTRKTSPGQSALASWLTKRENNQRFNLDVAGVNQKFFVDQTGKLFSVLIPAIPLTADIVRNVMRYKN